MKDIMGLSSTLFPTGVKRYTLPARWFHWVTALLIFTIIPLGWIYGEFKTKGKDGPFEAPIPGMPGDYGTLHKTLGLVVLALILARLAYRVTHRPPPLPRHVPIFEKALAHATHWILYLALLAMPISGYVMSSGGKKPISILGLFDFPKLPVPEDVAKAAHQAHLIIQYAVYGLVLLHIAGVCWSLFVRRDDILGRMLPRQANAE